MDVILTTELLSAGSNINESPSISLGGGLEGAWRGPRGGQFARHRRRNLSIKNRLRNCP